MSPCGSAHLTRGFILAISRPGSAEGCADFQQIKELQLIPLKIKKAFWRRSAAGRCSLGRTIYVTVHTLSRTTKKEREILWFVKRTVNPQRVFKAGMDVSTRKKRHRFWVGNWVSCAPSLTSSTGFLRLSFWSDAYATILNTHIMA